MYNKFEVMKIKYNINFFVFFKKILKHSNISFIAFKKN